MLKHGVTVRFKAYGRLGPSSWRAHTGPYRRTRYAQLTNYWVRPRTQEYRVCYAQNIGYASVPQRRTLFILTSVQGVPNFSGSRTYASIDTEISLTCEEYNVLRRSDIFEGVTYKGIGGLCLVECGPLCLLLVRLCRTSPPRRVSLPEQASLCP